MTISSWEGGLRRGKKGSTLYSQRAVFASPLSAFSFDTVSRMFDAGAADRILGPLERSLQRRQAVPLRTLSVPHAAEAPHD